MIHIHADADLVLAQPVFRRELVARNKLQLLASARPAIEIISAESFRRNQHVVDTLAVSIAVEAGVLRDGAQDGARTELIFVGDRDGAPFLIQIVRGGQRNQRVSVVMLLAKRESVHRDGKNLLRRKNRFERGERIEALAFADVLWIRQPAHRALLDFVLKHFGIEHLVAEDRSAELDARGGLSDAGDLVILSQNEGNRVSDMEMELILRRLGFHGGYAARKAAEAGVVRSLVHGERFHRGRRNRNGKTSRDRVGGLRRIHQKQALIFVRAAQAELASKGAHHTRRDGQNILYLLPKRRKRFELALGDVSHGSRNTSRGHGLVLLVDLHLYRDGFEYQRQVQHRGLPGSERRRFRQRLESGQCHRNRVSAGLEAFEFVLTGLVRIHR